MKTKVFKSYEDFLNREDKTLNGVTEEFFEAYKSGIYDSDNEGCWNCKSCSDCVGCVNCRDCQSSTNCINSNLCYNSEDLVGCNDCDFSQKCVNCTSSRYMTSCTNCSDSEYLHNAKNRFANDRIRMNIPVIENIHQSVLRAIKQPNHSFDMSDWHTCDTTHCRAGWVTALAGKQGRKLEDKYSTEFAAMLIYNHSSPILVSPVEFYKNQEEAMNSIIECAEKEAQLA
jgi:hypothetical protein